jgi:hypothetical protein
MKKKIRQPRIILNFIESYETPPQWIVGPTRPQTENDCADKGQP